MKKSKTEEFELPPTVMLYKFRCWKWGHAALRERRLKVATLNSLNDPFEAAPFNLSKPGAAEFLRAMKESLGAVRGILSFSWRWTNPVLWSHYAASHTGICLGFEVPTSDSNTQNIFPVNYIGRPLKLDKEYGWDDETQRIDPEYFDAEDASAVAKLGRAIFFTKYSHWKYEDEVRIMLDLDNKVGEHWFCPFGDNLKLRHVVLGARCFETKREFSKGLVDIRNALEGYTNFGDVVVTAAELNFRRFRVDEGVSMKLVDIPQDGLLSADDRLDEADRRFRLF